MSRPIVLAAGLLTLAFVTGCTRSDAAIGASAPASAPIRSTAVAVDNGQQAVDNLAAWPQASQ